MKPTPKAPYMVVRKLVNDDYKIVKNNKFNRSFYPEQCFWGSYIECEEFIMTRVD